MTEFQSIQLKKFGHQKICIDGTHGLNNYKFELFTVLVVDDYGNGVPAAFCFSNKSDTDLYVLYFKYIKERIGVLETLVFMSDDYPAFYNAWETAMKPVQNQLLCSWHVIRNWTKNLNKIANKEKRNLVLKTLQVIHKDIMDEDEFYKSLYTFLLDLQNDDDTKEFGDYFTKHYSNRCEKWAYCFRKYLGINTNMYLESLHKTIKQCKRLHKTIDALLTLVRDKLFDGIIKIAKNKATHKVLKIKQSHKRSLSITEDMFTYVEENEWFVQSARDTEQRYIVNKNGTNCTDTNCVLACSA